jgi:spore coat polysaccharide biosynthesis protein SpsF (cytidylyltransferase family)
MKHTFILVLLSSCAAAMLSAAEPGQITSKQELKAAEASARTATDYERIGYYYRAQANDFRIKEAEEEQAEARWASYYAARTKTPNPYNSAKLLASYY